MRSLLSQLSNSKRFFKSNKGIVQNLPNNFEPKDEGEYLTYLNLMIGNHVESAAMTENLQIIANQLRPSILNAPDKVVLLLTTGIEQVNLIKVRLFKIKISQFLYQLQTSKN